MNRRVLPVVLFALILGACGSSMQSTKTTGVTESDQTPNQIEALVAGTDTIGPARLETASDGLRAVGEGGEEVYFHLNGAAQGYSDGGGGIVYQTLREERWPNSLDVMWLPAGEQSPRVAVPAGADSVQLQNVSAGRVLTVELSIEETDGVIDPGQHSVVLTDLDSGARTVLLSFSADDDVGIGRASIRDGLVVVSLRFAECAWFEFLDDTGGPVDMSHNPRPQADACNGSLATGAVMLDGDLLAYVETPPILEYEFDGNPYHVVPFSTAPVQTVRVVDLTTGAVRSAVVIEQEGAVVDWLEPVSGGVAVSLGYLRGDFNESGSPDLPFLYQTPVLGDVGSDLGVGPFPVQDDRAESIVVSTVDGSVAGHEWWLATDATSVNPTGLCSAVMSDFDPGPPSGATGLGVDVPVNTFEVGDAVETTRSAIVAAARDCDYDTLADLALPERVTPRFFSAPSLDELAGFWKNLEDAGETPLAVLAKLLEYPPTGTNPFHWDATRGDTISSPATVSIDADGNWIGFQYP